MRFLYRITHPLFTFGLWFAIWGYVWQQNHEQVMRGYAPMSPADFLTMAAVSFAIPLLIHRLHKRLPAPAPRAAKVKPPPKQKVVGFSSVQVAVSGSPRIPSEKAMVRSLSPQLRQLLDR